MVQQVVPGLLVLVAQGQPLPDYVALLPQAEGLGAQLRQQGQEVVVALVHLMVMVGLVVKHQPGPTVQPTVVAVVVAVQPVPGLGLVALVGRVS